jgi:hypothetical protein
MRSVAQVTDNNIRMHHSLPKRYNKIWSFEKGFSSGVIGDQFCFTVKVLMVSFLMRWFDEVSCFNLSIHRKYFYPNSTVFTASRKRLSKELLCKLCSYFVFVVFFLLFAWCRYSHRLISNDYINLIHLIWPGTSYQIDIRFAGFNHL